MVIETRESEDQIRETGHNPYKTVPIDVQDNPHDYGNPYDDLLSLQRSMLTQLTRLADSDQKQRERPMLGRYPWTASGTAGQSNVVRTTLRYRVQELYITVTAACTVTLMVGTSAQQTFVFSQAATVRFSYPAIFDRGVDIYLTATGGVTPTGYFTAYVDA